MKLRGSEVNRFHIADLLEVGWKRTSDGFELNDSNLSDAIGKASRLMDGYVLNVIALKMGVTYNVPAWLPVRPLLLTILSTWDGNKESLPMNVRVETNTRTTFTEINDILEAGTRIILRPQGRELEYNSDWYFGDHGGWNVLPNTLISKVTPPDILTAIPNLAHALTVAKESESKVWSIELTDERAAILTKRVQEARIKSADVLRRLMDQALNEFNASFSSTQVKLRKYVARRKEFRDITNVDMSAQAVKEHMNAMRSVPGVDGVIVGGRYLYVRFSPYKVDYPSCENHVFKSHTVISAEPICEKTSNRCSGKRRNVCEDGHEMELGSLCGTCNKPYRGIYMECDHCGTLYKSFGEDATRMWASCTYCDRVVRINTFAFPSFTGIINLDRADDGSINMKAQSHPESTDHNHPHINYEGHCCWGSAYGAPAFYLREGLYRELVMLMVTLLRSYTPNDAYSRIHPWKI